MNWLATSIVLSIVLNVVLRAAPGAGEIDRLFTRLAELRPNGGVSVPWRAMIGISVLLTVGLNLFLWSRG